MIINVFVSSLGTFKTSLNSTSDTTAQERLSSILNRV